MDLIKNFALAALVALALTFSACSKVPKLAALPAGTVVLAIGDSVTHGTGAGNGEDYPTQLARITGWSIHNHGIPGDTSAGLRARIDRTVEGFHARVVQHECDHLIGKLFPMRMRDMSRFGFTEVLFPDIHGDE